MPGGLVALLDDVAALTKLAAASLGDVAGAAGKAGTKAAGVVIDDTAVTPRYVVGLSPDRELPIIAKIARGSLKNKLVFLLPAAVGLSLLAPWAIVPILMIWVGVGALPAVITAFAISFFPIVVNVATGLATIEPEMRDVLRSLGATRTEILTKVGIPRAMPYLFASLKVAITLAFIGSVISETVGGNRGIGFLMLSAGARNDAPTTFAGLFAIAIMGVLMYAVCAMVEKRMTRWAFRGEIVT